MTGRTSTRLLAWLAAGGVFAASMPALAQTLEQEIADLKAKVAALEAKQAEQEKSKAKIEAKGAPRFSGNGFKNFKIRGRLQLDAAQVSDADRLNDPGLGFTSEVRRARLGVEGEIASWGYKAEFGIENATRSGGDNEINVADVYISYASGSSEVVIGHQKTPFSLEELSSSRFTAFMERAGFTDAYGLERMVGVTYNYSGENIVFTAGAFSDGGFGSSDEAEGYGFAARAVYNPKRGDNQLHLGASVQHRANGAAPTRYRNRPLVHTTDTRLVNTDLRSLGVDSDTVYGIEAAGIFGPFYIAGEYSRLMADLVMPVAAGLDDSFSSSGAYVHAGYFFTGESRGYKTSSGTWDRTSPSKPLSEGGAGAFGVNLGFDYNDLADSEAAVSGGEQTAYLASLIWIPEGYVRFIAQYAHIEVDDFSLSGIPVGSVDVFGARAQIDW